MTRSLPKGIHYEVSISRCNGRWYASIAYWKSPVSPPPRETQSVGGVDVGINPLAMDSDGTGYQNPKGYYTDQRAETLATGPSTPDTRKPRLVGSTAPY